MDSWDDFEGDDLKGVIDKLADGNFEGRIVKRSERKMAGKDDRPPGRVLTLKCEITRASDNTEDDIVGDEFSWDQWLTHSKAKKILLDGLGRIGFDIKSWGDEKSDYPLRTMIPLALKYLVVEKPVLKLNKKTNKSTDGREFPNVFFNGRVLAEGEAKTIPNDAVKAVADKPETEEDLF